MPFVKNPLKILCIWVAISSLSSTAWGMAERISLELPRVLSIAIEKNPALKAARGSCKARAGELIQAGLRPNPEFSIEVENFGGVGSRSGFRGTETTLKVSQLIELGSKRSARKLVASMERRLAEEEYRVTALAILAQVEQAFWAALAAQKRYRLSEKLLKLAQETLKTAKRRLEAGKVSPMELNKASVMYSLAHIELRRAFYQLEVARKGLFILLDMDPSQPVTLTGELAKISGDLKPYPALEALLSRSPRMRRLQVAIQVQKARALLARSLAIPDVTLSAGMRRFEETNDHAFVAALEIPMPFFNRNQGNRLSVIQEVQRAIDEARFKELELKNRLYAAYRSLESSLEEARSLEREGLPQAELGFKAAKEGYGYGKFAYLDLLDAQRTLFQLRLRYIDVLVACHSNWVKIKSITGNYTIISNNYRENDKR